jgi:hypothetical protein
MDIEKKMLKIWLLKEFEKKLGKQLTHQFTILLVVWKTFDSRGEIQFLHLFKPAYGYLFCKQVHG